MRPPIEHQVHALAKELTVAKVFDDDDDNEVAMSLAVAEELVKLGVKKVEHLVDLDEAEVRAAAAASQLLPVQIKRLVKLRAAQVMTDKWAAVFSLSGRP